MPPACRTTAPSSLLCPVVDPPQGRGPPAQPRRVGAAEPLARIGGWRIDAPRPHARAAHRGLALAGASAPAADAADPRGDRSTGLSSSPRLEQLGRPCPAYRSRTVDHRPYLGDQAQPRSVPATTVLRYDRRPAWLGSEAVLVVAVGAEAPAAACARPRPPSRPARALRLQLGPQWDRTPATAELRGDTTRTISSFSASDLGTTVTMLLVHAHSFYGLQLDTAEGTAVIVLRA